MKRPPLATILCWVVSAAFMTFTIVDSENRKEELLFLAITTVGILAGIIFTAVVIKKTGKITKLDGDRE